MSKDAKETQRQMNRAGPIAAQVHRFDDCVAAWLGRGETVYLTPKEARKLARALNAVAKSCTTKPEFSRSTIGTFAFEIGGETNA